MSADDLTLREAMLTQRAIRRLKPDPVDDEVLLRCIELALNAPTGGNAQNWEWIVVRDRAVKHRLAELYRTSWGVYGTVGRYLRGGDEKTQRSIDAVQWQVDDFEDVPVVVVPCLRGPRLTFLPILATWYYGSIYPAVQNFLLACRAEGLGASLTTLPLWSTVLARRALGCPVSVQPVAVLPVGWPKGRYGPTTRKAVERVVHHDRYGNRPAWPRA
jgi:nitroreductase